VNEQHRSSRSGPRILDLGEVRGEAAGGKAAGLARLIATGLRVPPGFAIVDATPDSLPADLDARYAALGEGPVAVRSSALGEDADDASFAGQYDTQLGIEGREALHTAVVQCLESLSEQRAAAYRERRSAEGEQGMGVVVQRMVDARAAGVLFTADPVSHRRAHAVIDAVEGLGESLVSGTEAPDHWVLSRSGRILSESLSGADPILSPDELQSLLREALVAENHCGEPLDLEWALDTDGKIQWLQARPITTLEADLNELDTPLRNSRHAFTRCNIGEMFPGAATPLSISFTGRAIDVGMQMMHMAVGIQSERLPESKFISAFYGHMFLNLTTLSDVATQALGSSAEQMCLALCGRPVTEVEIECSPSPPVPQRLANGLRYFRYLLGQRQARREMKALVARSKFESSSKQPAHVLWQAIESRFEDIYLAMHYHLVSSASAGVLTPTLLGVLAGRQAPEPFHHAQVAALLAGAEDVESADIVAGAERIHERVLEHPDGQACFVDASPEQALAWLQAETSGDAGQEFRRYLERHGHRAVKELELRQREWAAEPLPLVESIQIPLRSLKSHGRRRRDRRAARETRDPMHELGALPRLVVRMARQAVRSREETKSGLVHVTTHFKAAYRALADALVEEGALPDADTLFFLTHAELGELASGAAPELAGLAVERRKIFPRQMQLQFPEVFAGEPLPLTLEAHTSPDRKQVVGAPVSRGRVIGNARIVLRVEDARSLREGEILIAPVTDVGWTPYFSLIAGLVTDVGSAVSHGAVVAREYRLPTVVNARIATQVFETGDRILLDGDTGLVRLAAEDD